MVKIPLLNFHAFRIRNPGAFARIVVLQTLPNGILVYGGPLKSNPSGSGKPQSYRFPKSKFTVKQAKSWLKRHNIKYILFEPAKKGEKPVKKGFPLCRGVSCSGKCKPCKSAKFDLPLEIIKAVETKSKEDKSEWQIEFYASTSDIDSGGDRITEEALKGAESDLMEYSSVLFDHDTAKVVGKVVATKVKKRGDVWGLWVRAVISKAEEDTWKKIKEGILKHFSIRGRIVEAVKTWDKGLRAYIREIKKILLYEVSLVAIPMNSGADMLGWKEVKKEFDLIFKSLNEWEERGGMLREENKPKLGKEVKKGMKIDEIVKQLDEEIAICRGLIDSETDDEQKASLEKHLATLEKSKADIEEEKDVGGEIDTLSKMVEGEEDVARKASLTQLLEKAKARKELADTESLEKKIEESFPKDAEESQKSAFVDSVKQQIEDGKSLEEAISECLGELQKKVHVEEPKKPKKASYAKKEAGDYTQKEIDTIIARLEKQFEGEISEKDNEIKTLKSSLETTQGELQKERDARRSDQATELAEKKWKEFEGKTYRPEDKNIIYPLLKKSFENKPLTSQETLTLVEKSITESRLLADVVIKGGDIPDSRREELIKAGGIRPKIKG